MHHVTHGACPTFRGCGAHGPLEKRDRHQCGKTPEVGTTVKARHLSQSLFFGSHQQHGESSKISGRFEQLRKLNGLELAPGRGVDRLQGILQFIVGGCRQTIGGWIVEVHRSLDSLDNV